MAQESLLCTELTPGACALGAGVSHCCLGRGDSHCRQRASTGRITSLYVQNLPWSSYTISRVLLTRVKQRRRRALQSSDKDLELLYSPVNWLGVGGRRQRGLSNGIISISALLVTGYHHTPNTRNCNQVTLMIKILDKVFPSVDLNVLLQQTVH